MTPYNAGPDLPFNAGPFNAGLNNTGFNYAEYKKVYITSFNGNIRHKMS